MTDPAARLKENQADLSHSERVEIYGEDLADILEALMADDGPPSDTFGRDDDEPADALTEDECAAINADGRDGRGWITESNLTPAEAVALAAHRAQRA